MRLTTRSNSNFWLPWIFILWLLTRNKLSWPFLQHFSARWTSSWAEYLYELSHYAKWTADRYRYQHIFCGSLRASGSGFHCRRSHRTGIRCTSDSEGRSATDVRMMSMVQDQAAADIHLHTRPQFHSASPLVNPAAIRWIQQLPVALETRLLRLI